MIPILNIYYLLCYAWNKLDEKDVVNVESTDNTSLYDLFGRVLVSGMNHLFKRGLDRGYVLYSEDSKCLKGKLNFSNSIKRNLLIKAQLNCDHEQLSYNVLHNQIIKTSCVHLVHIESLDKGLKNELMGIIRKLHPVDETPLSSNVFSRVQLNTNNYFYDFLLKICELIFYSLLVSEDSGNSKFVEFVQDPQKMPHLFEEFIRNFYRIELKGSKVSREYINWDVGACESSAIDLLPKMETDTSVEYNGQKIVVETKYSKNPFLLHYGKRRFNQNHLYQLSSYLQNLEKKGGINESCVGVLMYAKVEEDIFEQLELLGHKILVCSVDLNQEWRMIHNKLIEIIEYA